MTCISHPLCFYELQGTLLHLLIVRAHYTKHTLEFKRPSGTSRGILRTKDSWFLVIEQDGIKGYGECSVIKGLSPDLHYDIDKRMKFLCDIINRVGLPKFDDPVFSNMPAIKFCYEMAIKDLHTGGIQKLFTSQFTNGQGIHINGLVWMGTKQYMLDQIKTKIDSGFHCIKIKVAALGFDQECEVLKAIRNEYDENEIELRLDANGGFSVLEAEEKLKRLSDFKIHSIEQPIAINQWNEMTKLIDLDIIDVALDEELIGIQSKEDKTRVLKAIRPQYIILKPSLVGGYQASEEWISIAESMGIGWWVTSALESNIGLNAIAQWTATLDSTLPQGLGTGQLFNNNIPSPLYIDSGHLYSGDNIWKLPSV